MLQATATPRRSPTPAAMAVAIASLVLACFWPALHSGILWDDPAHLTRPELRSGTEEGVRPHL